MYTGKVLSRLVLSVVLEGAQDQKATFGQYVVRRMNCPG
jgi:hypothetical protein